MQRPSLFPVLAALLAAVPASVPASSLPILVDGHFDDWSGASPAAVDPSGDAGGTGIDFTFLTLANDQDWLYLRFDTTVEVQPDEQQNIVLGLDTDMNASTGQSMGGIGADLVWNLGSRSGSFYVSGSPHSVSHAEIGLSIGPTVSDTEFEVALSRSATVSGTPVFPGSDLRMAVLDDDSGDVLVLGSPGYTFDPTPQPVPSLSMDRADPSHIRIAGYNVENDGLFDGGSREAAQGRIMNVVDPDVWVFCEVWNHNASEVAAQVESLLPSGPGEAWYAVKRDAGNVVVSRFPILDSWEIYPGNRLTGALLDLRPGVDSDLLVIANHWNCCTADSRRQEQADAMIAFLRDARTPGGVLDLDPDTPIVACGDFNLVGWRAQLVTALTGDIADNGTWGPDSPPDWDGSDFDEANPRHPDARFAYSWRDDASSFYPGKLDWMFYTGSVLRLENHYVLETRTMSPATLSTYGLLADDTSTSSDHAPAVADFSVGAPLAAENPAGGLPGLLSPAAPNPFRASTRIGFRVPETSPVVLEVFGLDGTRVRTLLRERRPAGDFSVTWDGRDERGTRVASGAYFLRLRVGERTESRRLLRLR